MTPTMIEDVTRRIQRNFLVVADDLQRLDRRLAALVDGLDGEEGVLARELASTADAVRRDLLHDAVETLNNLGCQTPEGALSRQQAVHSACERLLPAGSPR